MHIEEFDKARKQPRKPFVLFVILRDISSFFFDHFGCLIQIVMICGLGVYVVRCTGKEIEEDRVAAAKLGECLQKYTEFNPGKLTIAGKEVEGLIKVGNYTSHPMDGRYGDFQFFYPAGSTEHGMSGASENYNWTVRYTLTDTLHTINVPSKVSWPKCETYLYIQDFTAVKR